MNFERFIASRISNSSDKKFSSLIIRIAIATIALSMVVMVFTTSVITGFKNQISSKVFSFWGHIHITDGNSADTFELIPIKNDSNLVNQITSIDQVTYRYRSFFEQDDSPENQVITKGGVEGVQSFTIVPGIIASGSNFEGILIKGLDSNYDAVRIKSFLKQGKFVEYLPGEASRDIVISEQTAKRMDFEVGQRVIVHFILDGQQIKRRFTISGIYKTGLEEYDRRFALADMRILSEVLGWEPDMVSGYEVFIENLDDLELLNDYIYYEILTGENANLASQSIRTKFYQIFEWLELQNINEKVIVILMVVVAIINMITALLIFVLERMQMIGMLKAMGATDWSIRRIFLYNAATILIRGLIIGNILAISLCFLQKYTGLLKLREQDYYLAVVPIEFNIPSMIYINLGTIVVTLLFLMLPSAIISQITPVKAVHFR